MPSAEQHRVSLDEAFRIATGHEPPSALTPEQQREYDEKIAKAWEDARRIYGDDTLGPAAAA